MRIICLGEALIDFKAGDGLGFQGYVGGSPLNVAVAASRLGVKTGFASQISSDLFGHHIRRYFHENGVDTRFVLESNAPSTLAFVEEREGEAHFTFRSRGAADTLYNPRPRPTFPSEARFILFGSISLLTQPSASSITDIVERHRKRCLTVFDPNVRPALIDDREQYLQRLDGWLSLAHIVKVSTQDLGWLYPNVTPQEVAHSWLALGPQAVVVTRGGQGVSLFRSGKPELSVQAPEVEVVDTVGAGDTFTGALMVSLSEGPTLQEGISLGERKGVSTFSDETWAEALTFASTAAALNCARAGADPPDRAAIDELLTSRRPSSAATGP